MNEKENQELTTNDYIEIIRALPPEALKELIRRYNSGTVTNRKTVIALSLLSLV
jgi:hypothetical protein